MLAMVALTVMVTVAAVGWTVSLRVRHVFEKIDRERAADFVGQFRREYQRRADSVALSLDRMAGSEPLMRIAFDLGHGGDPAPYLNRAAALAQEYQLDFLEIVSSDGSIVSSAQWPARFGYKEAAVTGANRMPFLKEEVLPDGSTQIGLFAVHAVRGGEKTVYLVGGTRLDREFLMSLPALAGTQIFLYRSFNAGFDAHRLVGVKGNVGDAAPYQSLINQSRASGQDSNAVVYPSGNLEDSVDVTAIPLKAADGTVMAVLIIANSRRGMVEVQQHIKAIAYGVAGAGILFAIAVSLWIAARVSRPIEQLARAAGEVAAGRWETRVSLSSQLGSHDEVGLLADSFNRMTSQLVEQRDRL